MEEVLELRESLNQIALTEEMMWGALVVCVIEMFFMLAYALIYFSE